MLVHGAMIALWISRQHRRKRPPLPPPPPPAAARQSIQSSVADLTGREKVTMAIGKCLPPP